MKFIADFHIHSKYSRATSRNMDVEHLLEWARLKGIGLLGTGDFTHHLWLEELKSKLEPTGNGLFVYKGLHFILTTEVCNIFPRGDRTHKIHNMIFAPSFEVVDEINRALLSFGNLAADGRPMLSLEASELVRMVLGISPECLIVPAHAWTPHFSLFGSNSGFNRIEDCFEDQTGNIYALETGLSSDPEMNWRLSALDKFTLISNSDAHSPNRIGREANVFDCPLDYRQIIQALKTKDKSRFLYTIEFFPQEGKYHYDGHRVCGVCLSPAESKQNYNRCPKCGRGITIGVMNRVVQLADRPEGARPEGAIPFRHLIPLEEIIASSRNLNRDSLTVEREYRGLIHRVGCEFYILLEASKAELESSASPGLAEGILRLREGKAKVQPGYDGVYGKIEVFAARTKGPEEKQLELF